MPAIPNEHAAATLLLTLVALLLFSRKSIPLETSCLSVLAILAVGFEVFPFLEPDGTQLEAMHFFSGFGHEALIAVCGLMIVGQGLVSTGALVPLGRVIGRLWGVSPMLSLLLTLVFGAIASAFVNNTPIVVLLIPVLINAAQRNKISAAPWLLPMNYSTLLGGTCTTIGTSTNLLVVGVAADLGLREFGMFDFAIPGMIAGAVGLLYLWLIAPRFLANHENTFEESPERTFTFQLQFAEDSKSIGKTVSELQKKADNQLQIIRIRKASHALSESGTMPLPDATIGNNDRITVRGSSEQVKELEQLLDATIYGDEKMGAEEQEEMQLAQIVLMDNSGYIGRTLSSSHFSNTYQVLVLAVHRANETIKTIPQGIGQLVLRAGDVLLIQGEKEDIDELKNHTSMLVLDETRSVPTSGRGPLSIAILAGVVLLPAIGIMPIAISAVCGALAMLALGCLEWRDIKNALSIPVIMIVVVSLALGIALTDTGATKYLAEVFLYFVEGQSTPMILSALIALMAVLTNIVSNNAAAVIGTPIAVSLANQLGVAPEAFVLAVLFGTNLSFATPMAYKTNVLVMSAGSYSFSDFLKVGLPLTLILWATYSYLLPRIYGF